MRLLLSSVLVSAVLLSPACAIVNRLSGLSEARAIQTVGEPHDAVVLEIWDTGMTVNDDPVVGLSVRVESPDRPPYVARIAKSIVSRVHLPQVQPGCRVRVFVDPKHPATRVALGLYDLRK